MKLDLKELIAKLINTPMVVESGTSGIWTYRKWSDGTSECWGIWSGTLSYYYSANGFGGYNSGSIPFPSGVFNASPTVTADGAIGNGFYVGSIPTATSTYVSVIAMGTALGTVSCMFHIHAMGKWK